MKALIAGAGLTIVLLTSGAFAQQSQQTTDDQQNLKNNVQAQPATPKREEIIRSESNKPDAAAKPEVKGTVGTGAGNK